MSNLSVFCLLLCARTRLKVELHLTFLASSSDGFFTRLKSVKATAMENGLKAHSLPLRILIFVMFRTFHDELQYIFLEKNFIFMVFLALKDTGTDVKMTLLWQKTTKLICIVLFDITSGNFNCRMLQFVLNVLNITKKS